MKEGKESGLKKGGYFREVFKRGMCAADTPPLRAPRRRGRTGPPNTVVGTRRADI